jgi:hypothetical protein
MWGKDVYSLEVDTPAVFDEGAFGFPLKSIRDIPPGGYYVQGFVNIYTEFNRADGHTVWLPQDQWEGQLWNISPGNLYSEVKKVDIDPSKKQTISLSCEKVIPPIKVPSDTKWVKRIKFQSQILTEFWGKPIYFGATILLPKGYNEHPDVYFPVHYLQGHFSLGAPFGFREDDPGEGNRRAKMGYEFYKYWISDDCPRMVVVTFQDPCHYYDTSYGMNSPNIGPYGDAVMEELIPAVEENFRIIRQSYARTLSGGSTGGWEALAMQIFHPDFFGGTFALCPDPIDFRYFQAVNIYEDTNAFYKEFGYLKVPTPSDRRTDGIVTMTFEQRTQMEEVMGTKNRSGGAVYLFEALFGPAGPDGYVKPLYDKKTGEIDPEVAEYWREHYDLRHYLQKKWPQLGPKLVGKIHIYTGDMDTYYLNNAVYLMEEFLESTKNPYYEGVVKYGDRKPHCWGPRGKEVIELSAEQVIKNTPKGENTSRWKY